MGLGDGGFWNVVGFRLFNVGFVVLVGFIMSSIDFVGYYSVVVLSLFVNICRVVCVIPWILLDSGVPFGWFCLCFGAVFLVVAGCYC